MPIRGSPNGAHHPRPQAGRNRPEWVVAINRNAWSQSIGIAGRDHPVRAAYAVHRRNQRFLAVAIRIVLDLPLANLSDVFRRIDKAVDACQSFSRQLTFLVHVQDPDAVGTSVCSCPEPGRFQKIAERSRFPLRAVGRTIACRHDHKMNLRHNYPAVGEEERLNEKEPPNDLSILQG